jgi:RNA polymerase sigma-70 factor (ECF subfamily)
MKKEASDLELVGLLKKGSKAAFEELLTRYSEKVGNLSLRITRSHEDAEEIVQDVFVTVYLKIKNFEGKSAFSSWLYRITVNTAFMKLRKRKKHTAFSIDDLAYQEQVSQSEMRSETSDVDFISSRHEMKGRLEEAIERLPEDYRAIFILRDIDGLSNQEVGEILSISVPAVKSRLHRSRLMLRKRLEKYYQDYNENERIWFGPTNSQQEQPLRTAA